MQRDRGDSRVFIFMVAYTIIVLALYTIVTMGSPALGTLLGSG